MLGSMAGSAVVKPAAAGDKCDGTVRTATVVQCRLGRPIRRRQIDIQSAGRSQVQTRTTIKFNCRAVHRESSAGSESRKLIRKD